jgi:CRP/FNR family transcriptional regulator, cyclic AMP receptor protein
MKSILDICAGLPARAAPAGTVLLQEGASTGRAYVLVSGALEVLRGDTQVSVLTTPGAMVGEMSVLLNAPHTASVRALCDTDVIEIDQAEVFFRAHPELSWQIARVLANRLNAATTYLVDVKRQYEGHASHLSMVGEVLEALLHQQERPVRPGSRRDPGY